MLLVAFGALTLFFVCVFTVVALRSRREVPFELVRASGYRLRARWFGFLLGVIGMTLLATAFLMPYPSAGAVAVQAHVVGGQFYWSLSPASFSRGVHVRFDVTSTDVNHGVGIYDPGGRLIGSVQAMPGYHNQLDLVLDQRGTYVIACLEYCGIGHHRMMGSFEVAG
jgi:cytochrome c oxidase subunit 2